MLFIHKITDHETVDFAAAELKKYLRMMMPAVRDVRIDADKETKGGFRLGLMQELSLDVSDAPDAELDDLVYIDTDEEGGIIAGDNARSVLLAVYEFLRQNGCRWLFPGIDGEYIPLKQIEAVKYRHLASFRFRGPCIEGSLSQEMLLETIDFLPKAGMNLFQMQFFLPAVFYRRRYGREYKNKDAFFAPEWATDENVLQWKTECEAELSLRSLEIHDVGHAWTTAPFVRNKTEAVTDLDTYFLYLDEWRKSGGRGTWYPLSTTSGGISTLSPRALRWQSASLRMPRRITLAASTVCSLVAPSAPIFHTALPTLFSHASSLTFPTPLRS